MPDDLRGAGALLLLYGLQLTRIVELTRSHLHTTDAAAIDRPIPTECFLSVTPDGIQIPVPDSLTAILQRLPLAEPDPRTVPLVAGDRRASWLFPGRGATGHVNASELAKDLRHYGISTRDARNAALIASAADLPPVVLSTVLGLSITTGLNWSRRAARDWNAYIATTRLSRTAD